MRDYTSSLPIRFVKTTAVTIDDLEDVFGIRDCSKLGHITLLRLCEYTISMVHRSILLHLMGSNSSTWCCGPGIFGDVMVSCESYV